jgi:RecA-family ATPase
MQFRCVAAIPNGGGGCVEHFYEDTPEGHASAEVFAQQYNRAGWGVYDCVNPLKERRRTKDNVAQIEGLHIDIDVYKMTMAKQEVVAKIQDKLMPFGIVSRINDSGRGVHIHCTFREPIEAGTPEADKADQVLRRLVAHLGADRQPAHFAALMRRPGTMNSKEGGGPCTMLIDTGARCDLMDVETYLDLVVGQGPLLTPHHEANEEASQQNGQQNGNGSDERPPVDAEAEYANMKPGNTQGHGVNATQCRVICSLIWKSWHPDDITNHVVDATLQAAERQGLSWSRAAEESAVRQRILSMYHTLFEKGYDQEIGVIPVWLPMDLHQQWAEIVADGRRPTIMRNGAGWYVRRLPEPGAANGETRQEKTRSNGDTQQEKTRSNGDTQQEKTRSNGDTQQEKIESPKEGPAAPFILRPFKSFDPALLPPREFLLSKHYQRRTVSGTVAPGGTGKSSLVMVESVAMATGRPLLGEEPKERVKVWLHNGEDNMIELKRRLAGICQHYNIPMSELEGWFFYTSGNEVPLRVAQTYREVQLQTDHRLVKQITEAIADNKVDVVTFDPLVTLHSVPENNPGQMDGVIRIFTRIADTQNCAIDLSHHTRKLPPGSSGEDYSVDDMRGARAISDAMRAVRILNFMSEGEAETAGLLEVERTTYFRIDRGKANYSPPSKEAVWRKFENVDLPNTDEVGVVVPWTYPGADDASPSPERAEAMRKAEYVFLEVLRRLTLEGRFVGEAGPRNAAYTFAKEREAKLAKVSKGALADAMRRLFDAGKIRLEEYTTGHRNAGRRIVET